MTLSVGTLNLIDLPDELLHSIFTYVASSPTLVGPCFCWTLRLLSKKWQGELDGGRSDLWELAVDDLSRDHYERGGGEILMGNRTVSKKTAKRNQWKGPSSTSERRLKRARTQRTNETPSPPRRSTRLRPTTPKENYIHHYNLLISRSESALLELTEHAHSSKNPLSLSTLQRLLKEYEPLAINQRVRTGSTFLVEVCRARHVSERVILKCIKLLIAGYGANPNVPSAESSTASTTTMANKSTSSTMTSAGTMKRCPSTVSIGKELYPLIIAAARGMSTVVHYLLNSANADPHLKGSSRFRLFSAPRKSVNGVELTAVEFSRRMREGEVQNGAEDDDLRGLDKAISLLEKAMSRGA